MTASSPRPAAPDTTGGELLRKALRVALSRYDVRGVHPWHIADELLAGPLRDLLAERDTLAAQVREGLALADEYEAYVAARGRPEPGSFDHGLNMAQKAAAIDLRRALGTPTTEAGQ